MKKYSVTTPDELRSLCIRKDWFSSGTNEQYYKMFEANENGRAIKDIALMIWLCTEDVTEDEILRELEAEHEEFLEFLGEQYIANGERTADEIFCGCFD